MMLSDVSYFDRECQRAFPFQGQIVSIGSSRQGTLCTDALTDDVTTPEI